MRFPEHSSWRPQLCRCDDCEARRPKRVEPDEATKEREWKRIVLATKKINRNNKLFYEPRHKES